MVFTFQPQREEGTNSARLHFAAQALWAWHRVNHLVSNVRDFLLSEPWRNGLYKLLDRSDLLLALSKTREKICHLFYVGPETDWPCMVMALIKAEVPAETIN